MTLTNTKPDPVRSSDDDPNDRHGQPSAPWNIYNEGHEASECVCGHDARAHARIGREMCLEEGCRCNGWVEAPAAPATTGNVERDDANWLAHARKVAQMRQANEWRPGWRRPGRRRSVSTSAPDERPMSNARWFELLTSIAREDAGVPAGGNDAS